MKNVFVVHSHTCFLTAMGVIDELKLKKQDIIFLFTRNYFTDLIPKESVSYNAEELNQKSYSIHQALNPLKIRKGLHFVDDKINEWIGDKYNLFVPHLGTPFFLILHTNINTQNTSLIQEGMFAIKGEYVDNVPIRRQLFYRIKILIRHFTTRFYLAGYGYFDGIKLLKRPIDVYAISPSFFSSFKCDYHEIKWPALPIELEKIEGPVFIFDSYVQNGRCSREFYLKQCSDLIRMFAEKRNHIKFHPNQTCEEREAICRMFIEKGVDYIEMDSKIPFEFYISRLNNMKIVGFGSSLLYLAHMLKDHHHHVICCDTWMFESPEYMIDIKNGSPIFHEYFNDVEIVEKQTEFVV